MAAAAIGAKRAAIAIQKATDTKLTPPIPRMTLSKMCAAIVGNTESPAR
jgi:hypothetical protein